MSTLPLHSARCVATLDETRAELRDASVFIRGHLIEIAANPKWLGVAEGVRGGTPAFSLVLHTWTQDLQRHIHLHAVMACGALGQDGPGWAAERTGAPARFPVPGAGLVQSVSRLVSGGAGSRAPKRRN